MLDISKGPIAKALRVIVYGPEGIGKSTFAAQFPRPVFIDTEGSTNHMDVMRFNTPPKDWNIFISYLQEVKKHPADVGTLVVDTADWAVKLCEEHVCRKYGKAGIEDFGYGKGYVYAKEEWAKALDLMTDIMNMGVNVLLTAHSIIRKFEKPDEVGAYDRYELKMGNKAGSAIAAVCKEWCDLLLFANYKEMVVDVNGKKKIQGGSRVMYTCHMPTWDAKNRFGMPPELPFDYKQIARIVPDFARGVVPNIDQLEQGLADAFGAKPVTKAKNRKANEAVAQAQTERLAAEDKKAKQAEKAEQQTLTQPQEKPQDTQSRDGVDSRILQLCDTDNITLDEISEALEKMGIAPGRYPVKEFPPNIIEDVIVHWSELKDFIAKNISVPF